MPKNKKIEKIKRKGTGFSITPSGGIHYAGFEEWAKKIEDKLNEIIAHLNKQKK